MKSEATRAGLWALVDIGGGQFSAFLIFLILARILSPAEYGVYVIALSILGMLSMILYQGIGDALIKLSDITEEHCSTAFYANLALAACIIAIVQLIAHPLGVVFKSAVLEDVMRWLSLMSIPAALVSVQTALLRRRLSYGLLALRTMAGYCIGGVTGVVLAVWFSWGVWALVASQLIQSVVVMLIIGYSSEWRPKLRWSSKAFVEISHFSVPFMIATVTTSSIDMTNNLMIGYFYDAAVVGYFALVLRMIQAVANVTIFPLRYVMLPVLSPMAHDTEKFSKTCCEMISYVSSVYVPIIVGLVIIAPALLPFAFGSNWAQAVPIVQGMCLGAALLPITMLTGNAFAAMGQPKIYSYLSLAQLLLLMVLIPISAQFGMVATAWAWSLGSVIIVPVHLLALRAAKIYPEHLILQWTKSLIGTLAMVAIMSMVQHAFGDNFGTRFVVVFQVILGGIAYLALIEVALIPGHFTNMARTAYAAVGFK